MDFDYAGQLEAIHQAVRKMPMEAAQHEALAGVFGKIAARLGEADAMEKELAKLKKPDNVVPIDKKKPEKKK